MSDEWEVEAADSADDRSRDPVDEREFYACPGPLTDLAGWGDALAGVPTDPGGVAEVVRGLVLHPFLGALYDVELPPERAWDTQIRPAAGMVGRLLELDPRPLVEARSPADRFPGNCRHFSVLTVALLRRAGVPARARCGFAGYFQPGRWVDHWVVEHWDGERWVTLDAQIDESQRRAFGLEADPADLPPGLFLPAGEAWQRCRSGLEDGDTFGILDQWGQWFIPGNVARDLAALNKVEVLPWDGWGQGLAGVGPPAGGDASVDEVAALTLSGDLPAIQSRYQSDPDLRVPPIVLAFATPAGPQEALIPELENAYERAWSDWSESEDDTLWELVGVDGVSDETSAVLSDPEALRSISEAERDIDEGRGITGDELQRRYLER